MSGVDHLDDCLDDEELDESEPSSGSANFGSLLGLGGAMRKKRPCLMLDPEEAENAARLVQHIAGHQFAGDDEAASRLIAAMPDYSEPPAAEVELDHPEPAEPYHADGPEPAAASFDDPAIEQEPEAEPEPEPEPEPAPSAAANDPIDLDALYRLPAEPEWPAAEPPVESWDEPLEDPEPEIAAEPEPAPQVPVPPVFQPSFTPKSHSLRRRIPTPRPARTFAWRLGFVLAWLKRLVTRG